MTVVSPSQSNAGDTIEAADVNTPVNQLAAVINGGLDNTNLADSGVTTAKIADAAVTPAKLIAGTGASWAWQTWTPTVVGWSSTTLTSYKYTQIGKTVIMQVQITGTSNSTSASITLPVTASLPTNIYCGAPMWTVQDNGSASLDVGRAYISPLAPTICAIEKSLTGLPWTASGTKEIRFTLTYEAA